jgi:hypothetical protein
MGEVYRARDATLGREVAIKVLKDHHAQDPEWLGRFEREARLLAALNHGNIATIHGLDEAGSTRYLVMEFVPGRTLADRIRSGPLPLEEALDVGRQIADALEAAHERGIVHRDLKPANVMITPEGRVKVLDFGLARSTGPLPDPSGPTLPHDQATQEGVIVGTPAYMAPEQARGRPVDKRCDLWALGCVLYESITGKLPFGGETYSDVLAAILREAPDWKALPPDVPPRVADLIRRCLQKDPRQRLRDAGDARLELEAALDEMAGGLPASLPAAPSRARRWPALAIAAALALLTFGLGMWVQHLRQGAPHDPQAGADTGPLALRPDASWSFLSGETTPAFGPRVSPDGRWVAFLVLQDGQTQVAAMDLVTREMNVLTQKSDMGSPLSLCWSLDSKWIYFDRFTNRPAGVFSISPFRPGSRPELILEEVECPQVLADRSMVVGRLDDAGNHRLVRHWPGKAGPDQEFGPPIKFSLGWATPIRALHKSNRIVFCGQLTSADAEIGSRRRFYLLDLDASTPEKRAPRQLCDENMAIDLVPLCVSLDDQFVYTVRPADDGFQIVRLSIDHPAPPQPLLTLTHRAYGLDLDAEDRLFIDQLRRPLEVLRFDPRMGGVPVRVVARSRELETSYLGPPVELPGGRVLLPSKSWGIGRLLVAGSGDPEPLLPQDAEESMQPSARVGPNSLAFLTGPRGERRIKIFGLTPPVRAIHTIKDVPGDGVETLAASFDGSKLYFVRKGEVSRIDLPDNPTEETRPPQLVAFGSGVAVYPESGDLLVQRFEKGGVRLFRVPANGEEHVEVPVKEGRLRLAPYPLGARAIHADGRVLVPVTSMESWFWRVAILEKDGTLTPIPVTYDGEIYPAVWGEGDKALGMGFPFRCELWRLAPRK